MKRLSRPSRRRALGLLAASPFVQLYSSPSDAGPLDSIRAVPSLGALAANRGVLFGTAFDVNALTDPALAALTVHHARILTTDSSMKFGALRPQEGPANFTSADRLVAFAASHNLPLRGHTLIWNEWNPAWLGKLSSARIGYWLDRHIDEVVSRYAGKIAVWDVVNEPFWPGHGKPGGFRDGPWFSALGKGYVLRALKRARAADPGCKIAINEAGPEFERSFGHAAPLRSVLLQLIDEAQDAGVRLDCIGLQGHWFPQFEFEPQGFRAFLAALAKRGVAIHLTELDVDDSKIGGSVADRDREVARRYAALITAALTEPKVEAILTWQIADGESWIVHDPKMWAAPDRAPRPLPFDAALQPKAAYHALARVFAATR